MTPDKEKSTLELAASADRQIRSLCRVLGDDVLIFSTEKPLKLIKEVVEKLHGDYPDLFFTAETIAGLTCVGIGKKSWLPSPPAIEYKPKSRWKL